MPATLLTGPTNSGQTPAVLDRIATLRERDPFARVVILTATGLQARAWQHRLAPRGLGVAIPVLSFYALNAHLLDAAGIALRELTPAARLQILKRLLADRAEAGDLRHFGPIAGAPGFRAALAALIFELKQRRVNEIEFRAALLDAGVKFDDLQLLYEDYQTALRETSTADHEGMGWRALEELHADPDLFTPLDLLAVDGFDQFTQLQADTLAALAGRSRETLIVLPLDGERPPYERFRQTAERLRATFAAAGVPLSQRPMARPPRRPSALHHVAAHLFDLEPPRVPATSGASNGRPCLALIEAPDRTREVRALARQVKQLLRDGARPDEIALLFYTLDPWAGLVREAFADFELPLALHGGHPLARAPAVVALLRALDTAEQRFERRAVLDLWTSPYLEATPLTPAQVQLAAALAAEALVTAGRDAWQRALTPTDWLRDLDDPDAPTPLVNRQEPAHLDELRAALDTFFQILTPPGRGTPRQLARWVDRLIGDDPAAEEVLSAESRGLGQVPAVVDCSPPSHSLHIIRRVRSLEDPALVARDLAALAAFLRLLRSYVEGAELAGVGAVSWAEFRAELDALLANATFQVQPPGGILVATIFEARGLPRRHILIGGLNEGEFPPPPPIDPLFSQTERAFLEQKDLLLPTDYAARDRAAFLEAATLATESLTLGRTYLDDKGNDWPPSPFWTSLVALFEDLTPVTHRLPIGHVPALTEVASRAEWLVAAAVALREQRPGAESAHNALLADPALAATWRTTLRGQWIERQREGFSPHDRFEGVLRDSALIADVRRRLQQRRWSASAFNDLGACRFRFYARRLLGVQAPEQPEQGPDARQIGSIQHEILEHTYRQLADLGLTVIPATLPDVLAISEQAAAPLLESAPKRHRFQATALWHYQQFEIRKRLERFLHWEAEQNAQRSIAPQPYLVELPFGLQGTPPLRRPAPWGALEVTGLIDRIDRLPDGLMITDYKSGSSEIPVEEMLTARNVQMAIYIRAVEQLFAAEGLPVREARFVHLRGPKTSGDLNEATGAIQDLVTQAEAALTAKLAAAWDGNFAVYPERFEGGRCARHCEYAAMCRVRRGSRK